MLSHRKVAQLVSGVRTQGRSDSGSHIPKVMSNLCFLQRPEKHFKGRTGKFWRRTRANACNVGTLGTEANNKGEAELERQEINVETIC